MKVLALFSCLNWAVKIQCRRVRMKEGGRQSDELCSGWYFPLLNFCVTGNIFLYFVDTSILEVLPLRSVVF